MITMKGNLVYALVLKIGQSMSTLGLKQFIVEISALSHQGKMEVVVQ